MECYNCGGQLEEIIFGTDIGGIEKATPYCLCPFCERDDLKIFVGMGARRKPRPASMAMRCFWRVERGGRISTGTQVLRGR